MFLEEGLSILFRAIGILMVIGIELILIKFAILIDKVTNYRFIEYTRFYKPLERWVDNKCGKLLSDVYVVTGIDLRG